MIEYIIALLLGALAGTFTGLTPGIHTNLIAAILVLAFPFLNIETITAAIFISSMAITHTFVDFIPSIFLGAPDEDTALGVMPGHKMLIKGKGYEAVILTLIGSAGGTLIGILTIPLILLISLFSGFLERMMSFILIWTCIFIISREKESRILAALIFVLAGFLGIASLNMNISQSLLPLLTGLFGSSTLIISILQKTRIPEQKIEKVKIDYKGAIKPLAISSIISPIFSFLPGLGSSEAAVISSSLPFYKKLTRKQFLILLGSINTVVMFASFTTLYIINKARSGAAKAIQDLMPISFSTLIYIIIAMVLASFFAIFITIFLSKLFSKHIHKFNYSKLSLFFLWLL